MSNVLIHTMSRAGSEKHFSLSGGYHHCADIRFSEGCLLMVVTACGDDCVLWVYDHADFIAKKIMPWSLLELGQNEIVWRSEAFLGGLGILTPHKLKKLDFTRI